MSRRSVFLDTGVLLGFAWPRDAMHEAATRLMRRVADGEWRLVCTSDYVIAETLDFVRRKVRRLDVANRLLDVAFGGHEGEPLVDEVLRIYSGRFAAAMDLYRRDFRRGLSFTDWTTVVAMRQRALDDLATFDRDFRGLVRTVGA